MEAQILFETIMDDSFGVDLITALEESKAVALIMIFWKIGTANI